MSSPRSKFQPNAPTATGTVTRDDRANSATTTPVDANALNPSATGNEALVRKTNSNDALMSNTKSSQLAGSKKDEKGKTNKGTCFADLHLCINYLCIDLFIYLFIYLLFYPW
jgi:hypothetical protein